MTTNELLTKWGKKMEYKQIREKLNQYVKKQANNLCDGLGDKLTINLTMPSTRKTAVGLLALTGCTTPIVYEGNHDYIHFEFGSVTTTRFSQGPRAYVIKERVRDGRCEKLLYIRDQHPSSQIKLITYTDKDCNWQVDRVTIREGNYIGRTMGFGKLVQKAYRSVDGKWFSSYGGFTFDDNGTINASFNEKIRRLETVQKNQIRKEDEEKESVLLNQLK